jgi:glycerol uptake facilitator-like aquaporin
VFKDIQLELDAFFTELNWTFIFVYVIVLYGIQHKAEFNWYNKLTEKQPWKDFKVWIAGFIVGLIFVFFHWQEGLPTNSAYFSQLLRSWIVVIVFESVFDKRIQKIENN